MICTDVTSSPGNVQCMMYDENSFTDAGLITTVGAPAENIYNQIEIGPNYKEESRNFLG